MNLAIEESSNLNLLSLAIYGYYLKSSESTLSLQQFLDPTIEPKIITYFPKRQIYCIFIGLVKNREIRSVCGLLGLIRQTIKIHALNPELVSAIILLVELLRNANEGVKGYVDFKEEILDVVLLIKDIDWNSLSYIYTSNLITSSTLKRLFVSDILLNDQIISLLYHKCRLFSAIEMNGTKIYGRPTSDLVYRITKATVYHAFLENRRIISSSPLIDLDRLKDRLSIRFLASPSPSAIAPYARLILYNATLINSARWFESRVLKDYLSSSACFRRTHIQSSTPTFHLVPNTKKRQVYNVESSTLSTKLMCLRPKKVVLSKFAKIPKMAFFGRGLVGTLRKIGEMKYIEIFPVAWRGSKSQKIAFGGQGFFLPVWGVLL